MEIYEFFYKIGFS